MVIFSSYFLLFYFFSPGDESLSIAASESISSAGAGGAAKGGRAVGQHVSLWSVGLHQKIQVFSSEKYSIPS